MPECPRQYGGTEGEAADKYASDKVLGRSSVTCARISRARGGIEAGHPIRGWSSDWSYGHNDNSWLGTSIEQADKAKLRAKYMAIGGTGNYHALCTFEDDLYLRRRVSKASWKKLPAPPLHGATIQLEV